MTSPISVECPNCKAKLKLKDEKAVGRKLPCPKCKHPFVVELPPAPQEGAGIAGVLDSLAAEGDLVGGGLPPALSPVSPLKTTRSANHSKSVLWKKPSLIAGAGLLVVLLVVGLVWMIASGASGDGELNLAYLPADSEMIASVRVADLWEAPVLQSLVDKPEVQRGVQEMQESIGLVPSDIESIIIGGLPQGQQQAGPLPNVSAASGIMVIRTSKIIDIDKLSDFVEQSEEIPVEQIEEASHDGENYYRIPLPAGGGPEIAGIFFPDNKTMVFGREEDVKSAIKSKGETKIASDFDFVNLKHHFLIAAVPEDHSRFGRQVSAGSRSLAARKLQETMKEAVKGFCLGLTLTDEIELEVQFDCMDSSQAKTFKADMDAALDETLSEGRQKLADAKTAPQVSPLWGELFELTEKVIDSIQSERRSTTVAVHAAVPSTAGSTLAKIPQALSEAFARGPFGDQETKGAFAVMENDGIVMPEEPELIPLESVSLGQYDAAWKTDIDVSDQSADELLQRLSEELGLELETSAADAAALAKSVSVKMSQKSRLEAVEEVCRQAELVPVYSSSMNRSQSPTLRVEPGPRRLPVTFAGPFLIEVTGIHDNAPYPTGTLGFRIYVVGLPKQVLATFRDSVKARQEIGTCKEITDPQGRDLVDPGLSMSWSSSPDSSSVYEHSRSVPLRNLLRSVTAIKTFRGNIKFRLPTKIETIHFDKLEAEASQTVGTITLAIRRTNITPNYSSFSLVIEGVPHDFEYNNIKFEFTDSEGNLMRGSGGGGSGGRGKWNISASVRGRPASLTAKLITRFENVQYDFQLGDIPFESYSEMPEKLAPPASFPGHTGPVSLEFLKIVPHPDFPNFSPRARFRIVNHADKKIQQLNMKFEYLDNNGKVMKEWPMAIHSAKEAISRDGQGIVVAEKATVEFDADAPFMPKETKDVKATVKQVRFVDAEVWKPEGSQ